MSASPRDMAKSAQSQLEKLKINTAGAQLMEDCIDLFIQASHLSGMQDLRKKIKCISENTISAQLTVLINLDLTATLHSMIVERTFSHYKIFRNDKRLSMSLQSNNSAQWSLHRIRRPMMCRCTVSLKKGAQMQ